MALKIDSKAVVDLVGMIPYKLLLGFTTDLVDTIHSDSNSIGNRGLLIVFMIFIKLKLFTNCVHDLH